LGIWYVIMLELMIEEVGYDCWNNLI
jgi:hypothetical protein